MPKSLQKIPKGIWRRLQQVSTRYVVAGYALTARRAAIHRGFLKNLGVELTPDGLRYPTEVVPPPRVGRFSKRNAFGYEIIRKDLPMETRYNTVDAPNWGDPSKGTHTVHLPYKRYPRYHYPPMLAAIEIRCPDTSPAREVYVLSFAVSEVLDRESPDFHERLLASINLLQENVGHCDIAASTASHEDYLRTLRVAWEILPPGTKEEVLERLYPGRSPTPEERRRVEDRYDFLTSLSPESLIYGTSGFQRYFGALIDADCAVFENLEYGNAIYVMFEDWQILSQLSRTELLSGRYGRNFERVIHRGDWKKKVVVLVEPYRHNTTA